MGPTSAEREAAARVAAEAAKKAAVAAEAARVEAAAKKATAAAEARLAFLESQRQRMARDSSARDAAARAEVQGAIRRKSASEQAIAAARAPAVTDLAAAALKLSPAKAAPAPEPVVPTAAEPESTTSRPLPSAAELLAELDREREAIEAVAAAAYATKEREEALAAGEIDEAAEEARVLAETEAKFAAFSGVDKAGARPPPPAAAREAESEGVIGFINPVNQVGNLGKGLHTVSGHALDVGGAIGAGVVDVGGSVIGLINPFAWAGPPVAEGGKTPSAVVSN